MRLKVPQPPIDPANRDPERHGSLAGSLLVAAGLALTVAGFIRPTGADTTEGTKASELQLMKAFASGGIESREPKPPAPPTFLPDGRMVEPPAIPPSASAPPLAQGTSWRVNLKAKAACPT